MGAPPGGGSRTSWLLTLVLEAIYLLSLNFAHLALSFIPIFYLLFGRIFTHAPVARSRAAGGTAQILDFFQNGSVWVCR